MKNVFLFVICLLLLTSCEEKNADNGDISLRFINRTKEPITISVTESNHSKTWPNKDIISGETYIIDFNIRKDFKVAEGYITCEAIYSDGDTLSFNPTFYTNFQYQGSDIEYYIINEDAIERE